MTDSPFSPPSSTDAVVVVLDDAELRALTWVAQHAIEPVGGEDESIADEASQAAATSPPPIEVLTSLTDRGLLIHGGADEGFELPATAQAGVVEIVALAHLRIELFFRDASTTRRCWYALAPDVSVCIQARGVDLWELRAVPTIELLIDLSRQAGVTHRPVAGVPGFEVSLSVLESVADHLAIGDRVGAESALMSNGAPQLSARAATDALSQRSATAVVMCTRQPTMSDSTLARAMVSWFDAITRGNWRVPITADDPSEPLPFFPAAAEQLLVDVGRLLPVDRDDAWRHVLVPSLFGTDPHESQQSAIFKTPVTTAGAQS